MDSMQKELDLWRRENVDHEIALRREERWVSLSNGNQCWRKKSPLVIRKDKCYLGNHGSWKVLNWSQDLGSLCNALEMSFLYVSIRRGVLDFFRKSRILGRFSKYNVTTMNMACADLKIELTNKRGTHCAPEVKFSPFCLLNRRSHSRLRCLCWRDSTTLRFDYSPPLVI